MHVDIFDKNTRTTLIQDISTNEENLSRKREMQKRFDVYRDRQDRYIEEKLRGNLEETTIVEMRKVLSINISKKIINEKSSIYNKEPIRTFTDKSNNLIEGKQLEQINNLYDEGKVNANLRLANRYFNLFHQTALMVVPQRGKLIIRPLGPHQYDVIPSADNPEIAETYILNVWDLDDRKTTREPSDRTTKRYQENDRIDQDIADDNDRERLLQRFVWWTKDVHFTTNGNGEIIDGAGNVVGDAGLLSNPIGRLPFIDIAVEKDFQFFVRRGQNITEFSIDFGVQISDQVDIARLQGFAQAVVKSQKPPVNLKVGQQQVLWLAIDKNNPELNPEFSFESPNPDLEGSLALLEAQVKFLLSSEGLDTSAITGTGDSRQFTSGMDRLLAMLDRFEASQSDIDLFRCVESDLFSLTRAWSNELQDATINGLEDNLRIAKLSDDTKISVDFAPPAVIETPKEKRDRVIEEMEAGLMSRVDAVSELRGMNKEEAEKVLEDMDVIPGGDISGVKHVHPMSPESDQPPWTGENVEIGDGEHVHFVVVGEFTGYFTDPELNTAGHIHTIADGKTTVGPSHEYGDNSNGQTE